MHRLLGAVCCFLVAFEQVSAFSLASAPSSFVANRSAKQIAANAQHLKWPAAAATSRKSRKHDLFCRFTPPRAFSSDDWLDNISNLPKSKLLEQIRYHLIFNTLWAGVVTLIHGLTPQHLIDAAHISTVPHSIMASALGLLLVFRSNASYARWDDARKIWGAVTNTVRNIGRLSHSSMSCDPATFEPFMEYLKCFPWMLKQHLQDERNDAEVSWLKLTPEEFERLQGHPNPPLWACERMTQLIRENFHGTENSARGLPPKRADYSSANYRIQLEVEIDKLVDALGMCERILGTPVPRSYSRHTSRFLTVYLFTLPIVLVPQLEWMTMPVVGAICWGLLSIEAIAYYIEDPFCPRRAQLPLGTYAQRMSNTLAKMQEPVPLPPAYLSPVPQLPAAPQQQQSHQHSHQYGEIKMNMPSFVYETTTTNRS